MKLVSSLLLALSVIATMNLMADEVKNSSLENNCSYNCSCFMQQDKTSEDCACGPDCECGNK